MTDLVHHYLPSGVILVSGDYAIHYVNAAAEHFLGSSAVSLTGRDLSEHVHPAGKLVELIDTVFRERVVIREYDFPLSGPRNRSPRPVNLQLLQIEAERRVMIVIDERGVEGKVGHFLHQRGHSRSSSAMSSILAHEVKNPLAGIRGAAQLLEQTATPADKALTQLICAEVDRIRDVIGEMEIFSNPALLTTDPVNIHEVLQYVRLIMEKGLATKVVFREIYDPSLPDIAGHRNLLVQLFLNLCKNAAEAMEGQGDATITLSTAYHHGLRYRPARHAKSHALPVAVTIEDNGPGIPDDLKPDLFDPFVTTKAGGKGLGLAIAAKIVSDHGGMIELDEDCQSGARFRILLPAFR